MGKNRKKKAKGLRFSQGQMPELKHSVSNQEPWYDSNLLWGAATTCIAIVLTVVAAMVKDLRWLLWIAWPFGSVAIWGLSKHFFPKKIAVVTLIGSVAIAYGMYSLSLSLKPPNGFVFVIPNWELSANQFLLGLKHLGSAPSTSIEIEMFDLVNAEVVEEMHRKQGKPPGLPRNDFYVKLFSIPEIHEHSLLPRELPYRPLHPLLVRLQFTISTHEGFYVEYVGANRETLAEPWAVFMRVADMSRSLYVINCRDVKALRPTFMDDIGSEESCADVHQIAVPIKNDPDWVKYTRGR